MSSDGSDFQIDAILASITSTKQKDRHEGLNHLKNFFEKPRKATLGTFNDKTFHKIFYVLFKITLSEKQAFLRNKKSAKQLEICAEIMRLVVIAAIPIIKSKTVHKLVEHLTQVLTPFEGIISHQPLIKNYVKSLRIIFQYPPHLEPLKTNKWLDVVDICIEGICHTISVDEQEFLTVTSKSSTSSLSFGSAAKSQAELNKCTHQAILIRHIIEELFQILFLLISTPNSPISERYVIISDTLVQFLQSKTPSTNKTNQLAFATINVILRFTRIESISHSKYIVRSVIPLISRFLHGKFVFKDEMLKFLRDEMLTFICLVHPYLESMVVDKKYHDLLPEAIGLLETMRIDYSKRSDRDQLQLDDLEITENNVISGSFFNLRNLRLRTINHQAEQNWAFLKTIGVLERLISLVCEHNSMDYNQNHEHPVKRQRTCEVSDRLVESINSDDSRIKLAGLQLLPFILENLEISHFRLKILLLNLHICTNSKNDKTITWALLAVASCSFQHEAPKIESSEWMKFWLVGTRSLIHPSTCRSASTVLHALLTNKLVRHDEVGEVIHSIINSAETSGPASVSDASIYFMAYLLRTRAIEVPSASTIAAQQVIRWLFGRWKPADRYYAMHNSAHAQPKHVLLLLETCLGLDKKGVPTSTLSCGPVAQEWQNCLANIYTTHYLLLIDMPSPTSKVTEINPPFSSFLTSFDSKASIYATSKFQSTRKLILDQLYSTCIGVLDGWRTYKNDHPCNIPKEMFCSVIYNCIVTLLILNPTMVLESDRYQNLILKTSELAKELVNTLSIHQNTNQRDAETLSETLIHAIHPYLPFCGLHMCSSLAKDNPHLLQFFVLIADTLEENRKVQTLSQHTNSDAMELDDDFIFTPDRQNLLNRPNISNMPRSYLAFKFWQGSFEILVYGKLFLLATINATPKFDGVLPTAFIDYLLSLNDEEFLSCQKLIVEILASDIIIDDAGSQGIIERIGYILSCDLLDRCEVTLVLSAEILAALKPFHFSSTQSGVAEQALQIYQWLVSTVIGKKLASAEVQKSISILLIFVLKSSNPEYGESESTLSARSCFFDILRNSTLEVRFFIADKIKTLFEISTIKDYDSIFTDILEILPTNADWFEGICFRIFVLSKLGSTMPTLRRRCLYYIFEIPTKTNETSPHATHCLKEFSSSLGISTAQDLFKAYASQLLYTWLEHEDFREIPYHIFGFNSLRDLAQIIKHEATALMKMRDQEDSIRQLASILCSDEKQLIQDSFTKVMAYCTAYDISNPRRTFKYSSGSRVKKCLGDDLFYKCIENHFAEIIAVFFNCLDQEQTAKAFFLKTPGLEYAGRIIERIDSFSSSEVVLPTNQQPLFKVKYLVAEIQQLCSHTRHTFENLFTPAMLTSLVRSLLKTSVDVIGSLHACSVLRKIKVLISLSGKVAIMGYPLEMLLHSLRFFLPKIECFDDTIGMIQYLLDAGASFLVDNPVFVSGISISILGSVKLVQAGNFGKLHENLHQSTKSKTQNFHTWIGNYLENYNSPLLSDQQKKDFRSLTSYALEVKSVGNANSESPESGLLLGLLLDEGSDRKILNSKTREIALSILIKEFRGPTSCNIDVCGDDERSLIYAPAILRSYRLSSAKEFQVWSAKVVGRAYASSGYIHEEFVRESNIIKTGDSAESNEGLQGSTGALLILLKDLTTSHDLKVIGVAESAFRYIVTHANKELTEICKRVLPKTLLVASTWDPYQLPPSETLDSTGLTSDVEELISIHKPLREGWLHDFSVALVTSAPKETLLTALRKVLSEVSGFSDRAFPYIIHLILSSHYRGGLYKQEISSAYNAWLENPTIKKSHKKMLLESILYLRTKILPGEKSPADRAYWLDIDYLKACSAAIFCGMFKTALLFIEESCSLSTKPLRRSSTTINDYIPPVELHANILLQIYKNIDDLDLYYGIKQKPDWNTLLGRLEYEKDGFKSLAFKGAKFDSHIRRGSTTSTSDVQSMVKAFDVLGLSGVSNSLLQAHQNICLSESSIDSLFRTSRKLEQWDIPIPNAYSSNSTTIYKVFQTINTALNHDSIKKGIDEGLIFVMDTIIEKELSTTDLHEALQTLAALVEIDEVFGSCGSYEFENVFARFRGRTKWMKVGNPNDVIPILSCRRTSLSILSQRQNLQEMMKIKALDSRLIEVQTALLSSKIIRAYNNLQESLTVTTSLIDLIKPCHDVGLHVEAAIYLESAKTLWDQGEVSSSIGMLQALDDMELLKNQSIVVDRSSLLSKIGHQISVAKLEKADIIIEKYLTPALEELNDQFKGSEAGQVLHQFASFCDQQLQDVDSLEDLERVKKLSKAKAEEVKHYDKLIANAQSLESKREYVSRQIKAKAWLKIDERDLRRQIAIREELLSHCLENYLLSLVSSDNHNRDALRFLALWLEHSRQHVANHAVAKHIKKVPSMKFARLMNQLTSRLQDTNEEFQELLFQLIMQICTDHPYHGMYQIFAGAYSNANEKDETAVSRKNATKALAHRFYDLPTCKNIWLAISTVSRAYCSLAAEKSSRYKAGKKFQLNDSTAAVTLNTVVKKYPLPSSTRKIPFSVTLDYSGVPIVWKLMPEFSIASGVSAPKIIVAISEDGKKFKQLVKGGNDDLRQDAIMEQVFEQVNELLNTNRSTQQRRLKIRTYKVLPLTNVAGIIEFVPDTMPLHEYIIPAHERFYPKDLKASRCRSEIAAAQTKGPDVRIKVFKAVTDRFHPVMRYFFTENFFDPDEWFFKRLAYVRSTAAISILGHILGIGDRHAHNILLDRKSGEIVHIDLGIAFEMGRILPIPETVPFRLTRDIIDEQQDGIDITTVDDTVRTSEKKLINEPGEAARALTGVNKKLTKTLSVYATVNDLINQASDEKNLALLFAGWAAYA
ncbi:Serine/threonine-protein kinase TEL1 [Golovinomyces cichoracearum]|uniref:Serine/threonine-protein kinase Tel1 n=1 Tax=Golovinomyces cichoracearum TaxID=62708 RepID=A0A420IFV4_9PEZI|nr:Serine/threonine-protein kinase TEL1 [Golovinomyces cichoracearum]